VAFVVLHTSPLHEPGTKDAGGMNVVVRAQAEELARLGHEVQLITRRSTPLDPDTAAAAPHSAARRTLAPNLTLVELIAGPTEVLPKGDHEALVEPFGTALCDHLDRHPVDIVHAQHWYSGLAALPVARELRIPILQSYHSIAADESTPLTAGERAEAPGRLAGERRLAHEADRVITVSEAEARTVSERLGAAPERIRVVPPGVDTRLFHPAPGPDRTEPGAPSAAGPWSSERGVGEVLVAGRLDPLKAFDLAVAAVAAIPPDRRPTLRIIGDPPPSGDTYARSLHAAVDAAGMRGTTIFEGALGRRDLAARFRGATLVLVPSHSETFGLVALEAAASGVPVIARAVGGLLEAARDGVTGRLIESDDPEIWAAEIVRLLEDRALAQTLGLAARDHAERHSWAVSAQLLLDAYLECLPGR